MNNYQLHLQQMHSLQGRPTLLIHICCGVCSVYPLEYLRHHFRVTVFFSNSNIYPYEEFEKRLSVLKQYLDKLNDDSIALIVDRYDHDSWLRQTKAYQDEPENGKRCPICYESRIERTFRYASEHHYDYVTTCMSISNRKNAEWINTIGRRLQEKYPESTYLYADFKKADGITKNEKMNKELDLYHQSYCGCEYSMR